MPLFKKIDNYPVSLQSRFWLDQIYSHLPLAGLVAASVFLGKLHAQRYLGLITSKSPVGVNHGDGQDGD